MRVLPVGAQTYSKAPERYPANAPREAYSVNGAWVDGMVDLTSGLGAVLLGHNHPAVTAAIHVQLQRGISYPLPTKLEKQVAYKLLDMLTWPKAECVRYGKNGADVTGSAVRLARAVTGRSGVAYLHYHGHHDWSMTQPPMNGGVPDGVKRLSDPITDVNLMMESVHGYAAVVLEAVSSAKPDGVAADFHALRQWCDKTGTLLILDEMVTGFRMAAGGAAEVYGIEPDIACYGKAMGNGMPLSAIVGPWDILKRYERDVFFSTTHGGEALSLAAALATLNVITQEDVPGQIGALGSTMLRAYGDLMYAAYPQRLMFRMSAEQLEVMVDKGVLTQGYANLTLAHVEDERAQETLFTALAAARDVLP